MTTSSISQALAIGLVVASLVTSGCRLGLVKCTPDDASYVLVEFQAASVVASTTPPEVSEAAIYPEVYPTVRTIGLQYPDDTCETETASEAKGDSRKSDAILMTKCGVWLAELERALTDRNYRVITWGAIKQVQQNKQISTYEAARSLGADVVFVVNSMEANDLLRDSAKGWRSTYFRSDELGSKGDKLAMTQAERDPLRQFAETHVGSLVQDRVIGWAGTLDVTAVRASTGESMWFFRHSITRPRVRENGMRFLFRKPAGSDIYTAVRPRRFETRVHLDDRATEDAASSTNPAAPLDLYKAQKHELARSVARECVERFSGGKRT